MTRAPTPEAKTDRGDTTPPPLVRIGIEAMIPTCIRTATGSTPSVPKKSPQRSSFRDTLQQLPFGPGNIVCFGFSYRGERGGSVLSQYVRLPSLSPLLNRTVARSDRNTPDSEATPADSGRTHAYDAGTGAEPEPDLTNNFLTQHAIDDEPLNCNWPKVEGYQILGVLGAGGMGVVYKARQLGLKRIVALKMILAGSHAGPDAVARFRVEAEAVARL